MWKTKLGLNRKSRHLDKVSRVAAYVLTFALTGFVCYQLGYNYVTSPIVVSVEQVNNGLIGDYFPAVTICNIRKWLAKGSQDRNLENNIRYIMSRRNRAMPHCYWNSVSHSCDSLFDMVLTDWETFCYTFNYDFPEKNPSGNLYLGNASTNTTHGSTVLLKKIKGLGVSNGISITLNILKAENGGEVSDLVTFRRQCLGFMVLVHSNEEFPIMASKSVHVSPGLENNILVEMNKFYTTNSVLDHPFANQRRNCYIDGEKQLAYFSDYSYTACEIECIINATLKECGCRHWTSPGSPDDAMCFEDEELTCYMNVSSNLKNDVNSRFYAYWMLCDCRQRCNYTSFSFTVSTALLDAEGVGRKFNMTAEYARYNMVIVNVFFGSSQITIYRREVLTTLSQLFSNIGGIVGSILGWSLFTIIRSLFRIVFRRHLIVDIEKSDFHKAGIKKGAQFPTPVYYVVQRGHNRKISQRMWW